MVNTCGKRDCSAGRLDEWDWERGELGHLFDIGQRGALQAEGQLLQAGRAVQPLLRGWRESVNMYSVARLRTKEEGSHLHA